MRDCFLLHGWVDVVRLDVVVTQDSEKLAVDGLGRLVLFQVLLGRQFVAHRREFDLFHRAGECGLRGVERGLGRNQVLLGDDALAGDLRQSLVVRAGFVQFGIRSQQLLPIVAHRPVGELFFNVGDGHSLFQARNQRLGVIADRLLPLVVHVGQAGFLHGLEKLQLGVPNLLAVNYCQHLPCLYAVAELDLNLVNPPFDQGMDAGYTILVQGQFAREPHRLGKRAAAGRFNTYARRFLLSLRQLDLCGRELSSLSFLVLASLRRRWIRYDCRLTRPSG